MSAYYSKLLALCITAMLCFGNLIIRWKDYDARARLTCAWFYTMSWLAISIACWYKVPGYCWALCAGVAVAIMLLYLVLLTIEKK